MILRRTVRRRRSAPFVRTVRAIVLVTMAGCGILVWSPDGSAQPVNGRSVTVSVVDVSATSPPATTALSPLTVTLALTNSTDQTLSNLQVVGARGNPITTRQELDQAILHPQAPDQHLVAQITTAKPVTVSVGPRATTTVSFTTLTSTDFSSHPGLCLCETRIYPLYFAVHARDLSGADIVVGATQTYVPAFNSPPPNPVRVSWVWPIVERPHRLVGDTTFIDDDLASSISTGRLSRVMSVIQLAAAHSIAMTLVVDPDLLDELQVMASGSYLVDEGGKRLAGSGTAAAAHLAAGVTHGTGHRHQARARLHADGRPRHRDIEQQGTGLDDRADAGRAGAHVGGPRGTQFRQLGQLARRRHPHDSDPEPGRP